MRAITAGVLAVGLLLSACSGAEEPQASPSPTASPSGSASSSPASSAGTSASPAVEAAPAPRPPRATDDRRGREAFARYVLQAWIYALNTNDPAALLDISGRRPCGGCAGLADELERRSKEGWYVELEGVEVSEVEVTARGRDSRAVMSVSVPASTTRNEDGSFRSSNPAHPRSTFEVEMVHTGKAFRLVGFSLS